MKLKAQNVKPFSNHNRLRNRYGEIPRLYVRLLHYGTVPAFLYGNSTHTSMQISSNIRELDIALCEYKLQILHFDKVAR